MTCTFPSHFFFTLLSASLFIFFLLFLLVFFFFTSLSPQTQNISPTRVIFDPAHSLLPLLLPLLLPFPLLSFHRWRSSLFLFDTTLPYLFSSSSLFHLFNPLTHSLTNNLQRSSNNFLHLYIPDPLPPDTPTLFFLPPDQTNSSRGSTNTYICIDTAQRHQIRPLTSTQPSLTTHSPSLLFNKPIRK